MDTSPDTKTVIVVDDEVNIVDLLVDIMASAGYRAIGCSVWTEAMNAINRESPDVVLLDLKMPTIDGPSMLEFIRGEGLDVPVIVVSGFVTDQVTEDLSKLGVSAFVGKPFRAAEILKQVQSVLADSAPAAPASMSVLYESSESDTASRPPKTAGPEANEVLAALKKLDGEADTSASPEEAPPANDVLAALKKKSDAQVPPSTPTSAPPSEPADDVLAALKKKNEAQVPPSAPPPAPSSKPVDDALAAQDKREGSRPTPTRPGGSASVSPADPSNANGQTTAASGDVFADDGRSISVTGHRRHHHRPPLRRKRFTKRNFVLFGSMFIICVAVAGIMAAMNWYAAQIDVDEIRKSTEQAITKQATQEIMQQLKDSR